MSTSIQCENVLIVFTVSAPFVGESLFCKILFESNTSRGRTSTSRLKDLKTVKLEWGRPISTTHFRNKLWMNNICKEHSIQDYNQIKYTCKPCNRSSNAADIFYFIIGCTLNSLSFHRRFFQFLCTILIFIVKLKYDQTFTYMVKLYNRQKKQSFISQSPKLG